MKKKKLLLNKRNSDHRHYVIALRDRLIIEISTEKMNDVDVSQDSRQDTGCEPVIIKKIGR